MNDDLYLYAPQWWLDGLQPSDAELQAMAALFKYPEAIEPKEDADE